MPELTCQKCGHEWEYTGQSDYWCSCPRCRTNVKVAQDGDVSPSSGGETGGTESVPPDLRERLERVEGQVETAIDAQASVASDLRAERAELEERVEQLERGLVEVAEILEEIVVGMDGRVDYEAEALADPDHESEGSLTVPEAVRQADADGGE